MSDLTESLARMAYETHRLAMPPNGPSVPAWDELRTEASKIVWRENMRAAIEAHEAARGESPDPGYSEREALAEALQAEGVWTEDPEDPHSPYPFFDDRAAIDAILAAGFRRYPTPEPVAVETVEGLEALADRSVVMHGERAWQKVRGDWYSHGSHYRSRLLSFELLPARVLS
ncbi:hypothetical protein [Demequina sp. SO4-18]|uniref:hypothetical protein n=1 Tax=Demequina sp. SO4-18 TaxID=3401026 RepID=UPI003B59A488